MVTFIPLQLLVGCVLLCYGCLSYDLQVRLVSGNFIAFKDSEVDLLQVTPCSVHSFLLADPVCPSRHSLCDLHHHEGENSIPVQEADPGVLAAGKYR